MKKILPLLVLCAVSLRAEMQFSGFMAGPNGSLFSFSDTTGHDSSGWLKIGQSFLGHKIVAFDPEREIITLQKAGEFLKLRLRDSKVTEEATSPDRIPSDAVAMVTIPPLETIQGLIGLDEAIAAQGREAVERRMHHSLSRHINRPNRSREERTQLLADYVSGKKQIVLLPPTGIDAAFAKKYRLTPQEVETVNRSGAPGSAFVRNSPGSGEER